VALHGRGVGHGVALGLKRVGHAGAGVERVDDRGAGGRVVGGQLIKGAAGAGSGLRQGLIFELGDEVGEDHAQGVARPGGVEAEGGTR